MSVLTNGGNLYTTASPLTFSAWCNLNGEGVGGGKGVEGDIQILLQILSLTNMHLVNFFDMILVVVNY